MSHYLVGEQEIYTGRQAAEAYAEEYGYPTHMIVWVDPQAPWNEG